MVIKHQIISYFIATHYKHSKLQLSLELLINLMCLLKNGVCRYSILP